MSLFVVCSYGLCFLIATVVGLRLLRIALRTRKAPETGIGLAVFTLGFGTAGMMVGQILASRGETALGQAMAVLGFALVTAGTAGLYLAIRVIFRPNSPWAAILAFTGSGFMIGAFAWRIVTGGTPTPWDEMTANAVFLAGRAFIYAWGAFESFRYALLLRRRLALGLAEPMAVAQLICWGIASTCIGASVATISYGTFVLGARPATWPAGISIISGVSLTACLAIWLAFMAPASLRRRVEGWGAEAPGR